VSHPLGTRTEGALPFRTRPFDPVGLARGVSCHPMRLICPSRAREPPPTTFPRARPSPSPSLRPPDATRCRHLPGLRRVIAALGGPKALDALVSGKTDMLSLKFRPEDPFCHPAFSERGRPGLLLRLTAGPAGAAPAAEVSARVTPALSFPCMADFQYRPPTSASTLAGGFAPALARPETEAGDRGVPPAERLLQGGASPLCMVPPLFSKRDAPVQVLGKDLAAAAKRAAPPARRAGRGGTGPPGGGEGQGGTGGEGVAGGGAGPGGQGEAGLLGGDGVERVPGDSTAVPEPDTTDPPAGEEATHQALAAMLEQQPVWVPEEMARSAEGRALAEPPHRDAMARAVARSCYQFRDGPWAGVLIQRGYDPRDDPTSPWRQAVAVAVPDSVAAAAAALGAPAPRARGATAFISVQEAFGVAPPLAAQVEPLAAPDATTGWWSKEDLDQIRGAVADAWAERLTRVMGVGAAALDGMDEGLRELVGVAEGDGPFAEPGMD